MTPRNPDSFIDLSTTRDRFRPPEGRRPPRQREGQRHRNSPAVPRPRTTARPGTRWTRYPTRSRSSSRATSRSTSSPAPTALSPCPPARGRSGSPSSQHSRDRRDDLGTTHHDAGTMRMGDNVADAVTNDFGRIHDTTNCYVAGPALFPTVGSPNPMLTGVALGRRTGDLLNRQRAARARTR